MMEIIPKEAPKSSKKFNVLFYFSLFLLFFSIAGYFLLNNSLKKGKKEISDLESISAKEMSPESIALEKEILKSKDKIDDFSDLINQHLKTSKIFEIVQKTTHPKVWFSKFDLNSRQGQLKLSGRTQNFETLGQQILLFKKEEAADRVNLEKFSITKEGEIDFNLSFSLNPGILK